MMMIMMMMEQQNLLCVTSRNVLLDWDLLILSLIEMSNLLLQQRESDRQTDREQNISIQSYIVLTELSLVEVFRSTQDLLHFTFYVFLVSDITRHYSLMMVIMMMMMMMMMMMVVELL